MPTITFSLKDLNNLVGKKLGLEELDKLCPYAKAELDSYNKETDEITLSVGDTNQPYLWSVEGISRLFKGVLDKETGLAKLDVTRGNYEIIVDKSVSKVRPYIAAFVAKKGKIDDYLLKQMIQLQEKLCEGFGRKRKKVAIGIYSYEKIKFPVHYKTVSPEGIKFVPLDYNVEMTPQEILEDHPKGKEYAHTLEGMKQYPIIVDSENNVLSFPPIINSKFTGKIDVGDEHLFIEATGDDLEALRLAINIFAYAFQDRGFEIHSVNTSYDNEKKIYPMLENEKIKLKKASIKSLLGIEVNDEETKELLEKARYGFNNYEVIIPIYRADILHEVDVIEDVGIMFGYDNIPFTPLTSYTVGSEKEIVSLIDRVREIILGFGYQEIMSNILSNKAMLFEKMNVADFGVVEIEEYMSETYSVVRSWILPQLMDVLSKNKHIGYPQKIFEQGLVTANKKEGVRDYERVALISCDERVDFTEVKQILDRIFALLGVEYESRDIEHNSFMPGRVARISVGGKDVAFLGEMHPKVLSNFGIKFPAAGFELNLTDLYESIKTKK